jgi:hypothetical protein
MLRGEYLEAGPPEEHGIIKDILYYMKRDIDKKPG